MFFIDHSVHSPLTNDIHMADWLLASRRDGPNSPVQ